MQHIAVRKTSELSNFVESLLPSMKVLLRSLHKPHGDVLKDEAQFQRMIISVLVEIIKIVSKCSGTAIEDALSLSFFPDLGEVLLKMLQRRDLSYLVKADTLDLIGVIIHDQRAPETMLTGILSALEVFVVEEFPIVSTDVQKETKNYEIYSALFEQVLSLVERSGQVRFLRVLFSSLKEGKQHIFYAEINQTLSGFVCTLEYKKHLDSAKISKEMMELMEILLDKNVEDHIRTNLLDQVFRPLLERLSLSSSGASIVGKFFITETKSKGLITRLANLMSSSTDMISIPGLVTGTVAFSSMEMLYRLVDADFIRTEVNSGFLGHTNGKGRELTMLVCKMASKFITTASNSCGKIDGDNSNEQFLEAYRIFYCNGYNCLLTAVSRTQKLEKFFDQILFPEVVWDKIIDTHRSNKFSAETPTFERIDVSLRLSVAASLQLSSTVGHSGQRASRQQKEKPSQSLTLSFLTGSSLSQATESLKSHDDVAESEIALLGVEFELDQWNQHESMLSLIRVLLLMFADFGSNWQPQLMPEWMKKIYGVISSSNKPLNIRVFLAKLVLNIPQVFEKYASSWIESIMDVMIQASIEVSTPEFHHILRDFCHLLIESWNAPSIVRAISTSKVSQFFNRLIPLCPSENNTVIQNNLLLMHQMLLLWSNENKVQVDWDELGHLLCEDLNASSRLDAGRKMTALQVMSVLLVEAEATSGGLSIFSTMEEIINGVLTAVSHKRNSIQVVAAEIVGLLLKYMNSESLYTHLRCHLTDQVQKLMTKAFEEEEYLRFLIILRNVSLHEPSILNEQMFHRLSFVLPKVIMIDKCAILAMEIFYAASKSKLLQLKQIFVHMEPLLQRFMEHCSSQVQHLTLETISLLLDGLDQNQYSRFLRKTSEKGRGYGLIEQYRNHPAPSTRSLLMDVLLKLLSLQLDTSDQHQVNIALLCGLTDPEPSLREKMFHIWTKRLSISAENRLKALFGELYAPSVSNKWVHYAAGLLLATAQHSEKFNDVIFTSNLQIGEDLQDMVVDSTWEGKSNVLTPLFSVEEDPLASSVMASQLETQTQTMLAATRSTQLDSTLSFASQNDNGYDTSTNVLSSSTLGASLSLGSQSALGPSESQYDSISQESAKRNLPRRRFINRSSSPFSNKSAGPNISKSSDKTFFQQQYALLRKAQQAMNQRQRRARKETVKMRRKYRIGTFPDIQVTMKDILSPLMALCELNVEISTSVFANVFAQIVSSITSNSIKDLAVKIDTVLSTDKTSDEVPERINGGFVACVQLALTNALKMKPELFENMAIPSSTIGESSLLTGNYHSGEVLLEEKLNWIASSSKLHEEEKARCWDQLYRLLSMLQNNNLLLALNNSTSNVEASYLATTAKLNGDISIAASSYLQAQEQLRTLEKDAKDETSLVKYQLESQRCYWERLNCMETLNQWEKTYQEISHFIVDENSFWKETSPYLEKALGLFLRSSVGITKDSSEKILDGFTFLKNCFEEKERWRLIKTTYPVETCLVFLNQESDESNRVRALVEDFYLDFLQKWQHTTSLSIPSRQKLLQNLSSMVEIDYFLQLNKTSEDFENFVAKWIHVTPDLGQGLLETWSQYYMVQSTLIPELIHFGLENSLISETSRIHILKQEADAMLLYANAAMANDVLSLASKYLKNFRERCREEEALPNVTVRMVDVFLSHVIKLADKKLKTNHSKDTIPMVTRYHATSTRMFDNAQVLELVQELSPQEKIKFGFLEAKAFAKAAEFHLAERVNESLGEESLQRALEAFDRSSRSLGTSQLSIFSERSRHRMEFIEFLMDLIMGEKKEVFAMYVNRKNLVQLVSESVLQGMSEGDKECAYYFPQLLDLVAEFKQDKCLVDKFQSQILTQVPAWTCLRWSAQLMALIDGPIGPTIIAILEKMAKEYPSALFYDFKITCSKKIHTDYKSKGIDVTRLERLLENSTMERFVDSLRMIHHPEIRFKEGLREVAKLFEEGYTQEAKIKFESVWKDCFALERPILGDKIGRYNREWARKTRKDIEKIMGKNGTNVTLKTVHTVRDYITNHFSVTPGKFGIGKDMKARLGDFAEWLEEFNPSKSTVVS
jgi:DNA-dependent protein kinase catalytic subunit